MILSASPGMTKGTGARALLLLHTCPPRSTTQDALSFSYFQNAFLQETVRRECEERFQLTEALSQAREQLLELQKLNGSLPLSRCSLGPPSLTSPAASMVSTANTSPGKGIKIPSLPCASKSPNSQSQSKSSGTSIASFPVPKPPKGKVSSVNETRQRMATILQKRLGHQ